MPPVVRPRRTSAIALPAGGAPLPEPGRRVPLSPFDAYWVTLPPVRRVFLYRSRLPFTDVVGTLRSSLDRVLPAFHPFAGALTYSPESHALSIVLPVEEGACSVAFVEAETDVDFDRLVEEEYDEDALRQLAPDIRRDELPAPVMAAQVTEFVGGGGGVAVGVAVHHSAADGRGLWRFLEMWSATAAGSKEGQVWAGEPLHDRRLVRFDGDDDLARLFLQQLAPDLPRMEDRDVYDCIDVDLQPAFNHPLLKDHKIQMEPSSFPVGLDTESGLLDTFSQVQPPLVDCPIGTVPILQNSGMNQIARHNIDEVISNDTQHEMAGIRYGWDDIYGTRATISIHEPKVKKTNKDDSASWIQINSGPKVGLADGIGAGSAVSLSSSGDSFARFHVGWQLGRLNLTCEDHQCPGFVQVNHNFGLGGRIRPVSTYDGPQYVIHVLIFKDPRTKNWWVAYGENNTPIGYWPGSLLTCLKR